MRTDYAGRQHIGVKERGMKTELHERTRRLLELLAHDEEPMGVFYTHEKPQGGYGPKKGELLTREREAAGLIDWQRAFADFSCIIGNIWLARKKGATAWLSHEECGCMGGGFYAGFYQPCLEANIHYVSHGIEGTSMEGERYLTPEGMREFMEDATPPEAPARYCAIKRLSAFTPAETPEVVAFFVRPEVVVGLHVLTSYATGSHLSVVSPFGACCTAILGWPRVFAARGEAKAVLGGFDPSARRFLKTDEMTFALPLPLYERLLDAMEHSALPRPAWENNRKKVLRSRKTWGETS